MKIAFFGSSLVSAYWNGAATYYRGIIRALHARGHVITFYEPDAYDRQLHRDMEPPFWCKVVVYPNSLAGVEAMLKQASKADLVIKASGVGVFDELLERAVIDLKSEKTHVLFWDVDAPATLDRMKQNLNDPFRSLVDKYDLVLTYGGGLPVIEAYRQFGAQDCVPIYNALDPDIHFPAEAAPKFKADLSFLGNRLPDREARVHKFFFEPAASLGEYKLLLGGNGWANFDLPKNVNYVGHVYTQDHNAFNSSARIVLNISRASMASYGFSPATRVFEAAGAAACIATDYWMGIEDFFEPNREILVCNDGVEVAELVKEIDGETSKQIGLAAYKRVLADHTYTQRAAQLEQALGVVTV
jgi:spore maturation protein CgeB